MRYYQFSSRLQAQLSRNSMSTKIVKQGNQISNAMRFQTGVAKASGEQFIAKGEDVGCPARQQIICHHDTSEFRIAHLEKIVDMSPISKAGWTRPCGTEHGLYIDQSAGMPHDGSIGDGGFEIGAVHGWSDCSYIGRACTVVCIRYVPLYHAIGIPPRAALLQVDLADALLPSCISCIPVRGRVGV